MSDDQPLPGSEEQDLLFEHEPDWKDTWAGMPDYSHEKLEPWQSIYVHFKTVADRESFAKLVGQRISSTTKFIWHPKAEIGTAADKVWTGARGNPRHPVYIISKGRADTRLTSKAFEFTGVPYHIVVEPQEYDQYAAVIDPRKILVLPFSNLGLGGIPARNWVWEHAISTGAERHWIFDDNVAGFCRFHDNLKVEVDSGILLKLVEDWCDRYENVVMAAFNYDYFAPRKQGSKIKPITLNTRCYSGILLRNDITDVAGQPIRWRGRYNEDTDLSLRILKDGATPENHFRGRYATALFNAFLMYKKPTLTMKGGNTDQLYAGAEAMAKEWENHAAICADCGRCTEGYTSQAVPCAAGRTILSRDGRWLMAESLREQHPDVTTVERKWRRWQHQVDYRRFVDNPLVLRPDAVISEEADHGFALAPMPADNAPVQAAPPAVLSRLEAPKVEASRPEPLAAPPAVPAVQAAAGPSALDFALAPSKPEQPEGASSVVGREEDLPFDGTTSQPSLEQLQEAARRISEAELLRDLLAARGHRLLTKDGKLFVTSASLLSDDERGFIKDLKAELLGLAELPPSATASQSVMFEAPAQPAAAQFTSPKSDDGWRPDEPPDLRGIDTVVLNFATSGLDWSKGDRPIGLTVSTLDGKLTRFLPFGFEYGGNHDEAAIKRWAREHLRGKRIVNSKTKFDVHMSREWGVDLEEQGCTFSDVQHTAALLDDHRKRFAIDILAAEYLPDLPIVARVDESRHANHHASDVAERERFTAQLVGRLTAVLQPQIDAQDLRAVHDLEDEVIPVVVEMERNGALIDLELLEQMSAECNSRHDNLMWEISKDVGFAFDHTAAGWERLLNHLGLPQPDAYDEPTLNLIDHPMVRKGQSASQLASLNSKIFKPYKERVGSDGILRFEINQLRGDDGGTVSGRFSIGYVQQVPNHDNHHAVFGAGPSEECAGLCDMFPRRLFVSATGLTLAADAMQIENRLFSHYAKNPKVIAAYKEDPWQSFHKMTWAFIKAYKADMLYSHQKSFNFARQYGAKSVKLAVMMKFITAKEGEEIRRNKRWDDPRLATIHDIERAYGQMMPEGDALLAHAAHLLKPSCDEYCNKNDKLHRTIEHRGFVKTLLGRRSRSPNGYKSYIGLNRVLQGTGADILKRKMVELHNLRKVTGFLMRITAHDELTGDAGDRGVLERVMPILNHQSFDLRVPILWEGKIGRTWADCK